jgi:hypothetical protein
MRGMDRSRLQLSVTSLLILVACVAVNFWLFRLGVLWGILGLNVSKHVLIAYLCQALSVNQHDPDRPASRPAPAELPAP